MNDALTTALQPVLAEARKRMAEGMAALRAEYEARPHTATLLKGRAALVGGEERGDAPRHHIPQGTR